MLPFSVKNKFGLFLGGTIYVVTAFWMPFFCVRFHLKRASGM